MSKLVWDATGEHYFETGVDHGVLYPYSKDNGYKPGVAWNGLTGITESPSGAEATALYADNIKYLNLYSAEEFGATVEAYTYPDEFEACDGTAELATGITIGQQSRKTFGLAYKTQVGNDTEGNDFAYKLHLIYGCMASPSERSFSTINDSPEAITFSWEIKTTPVNVAGFKPTANVTIDTSKLSAVELKKLARLEAVLFGVDDFDAAKTYAVGEYAVESNKVYKCKTAITTPGVFNASDWDLQADMDGIPTLPLPNDVAKIFAAG